MSIVLAIVGGLALIIFGLIVWMVVGVKQAMNRNDNGK